MRPDRDRAEARTEASTSRGDRRDSSGRDSSERRDAAERRESKDRRDRDLERREVSERRDPDRSLPDRSLPDRSIPDRRDQPLLPAARTPRTTVDAAFAPLAGESVDAAFSGRTDVYGATELRRTIAAGGEPMRSAPAGRTAPAAAGRPAQPGDSDPLTSPSFPRITDDSRSYRRGRSDTPGSQSGQHAPYQPPAQHSTGPQPVMQQPGSATHPPVGPLDSQPGHSSGYSRTSEYAAAPPALAASSLPLPAAAPPAALPAAPPAHLAPATQFSLPAAPAERYQPQQSPENYPAHSITGSGNYQAPAASSGYAAEPSASYLPSGGNAYPADSATSPYSAPMPAAASYSSAPSYPGHDAGGFGNGLPASPDYGTDHDSGGYSVPAPAAPSYQYEQPPGYASQGYQPAAQAPPTSYQPPADHSFGHLPPAQLPQSHLPQAAQPSSGQTSAYGYHESPQADRSDLYQVPPAPAALPAGSGFGQDFGGAPVQPTYPAAPYGSAPYEPAGYPAPVYEADTAYPADPYAVDPYGYPGYGSGRLAEQRPLAAQPWEDHAWQGQYWDGQAWPAPVWDDPV